MCLLRYRRAGVRKDASGAFRCPPSRSMDSGRSARRLLSGNGPLVQVLRYAIAVDVKGARKRHSPPPNARRAPYPAGSPIYSGTCLLISCPARERGDLRRGAASVGRRHMEQKQGIPASEAATTLDIMARVDGWSVVIALIGEGQEMNDGEAALRPGLRLADRQAWEIRASHSVTESVISDRIKRDDALELEVSVRSPRARAISDWADALPLVGYGAEWIPAEVRRVSVASYAGLGRAEGVFARPGALGPEDRSSCEFAGTASTSIWDRDGRSVSARDQLATVVRRRSRRHSLFVRPRGRSFRVQVPGSRD